MRGCSSHVSRSQAKNLPAPRTGSPLIARTVRLLRRIAQRSPHLFALLALAFILLFLVGLRYPRADGHLISGDGIFYYATMRSALLDGDVRVVNDLALANARVPPNSAFHGFRIEEAYVFPIGPSILWSPFFLAGHGLAVLYHTVGASVEADGFSWIEESFVCVAGILYGCLGLYFTFRLVSRWVPEEIALVCGLGDVRRILGFLLCGDRKLDESHVGDFFASAVLFFCLGRT